MSDNLFFDRAQLKRCGTNVIIGRTVRIRNPELVEIADNVIIDDFTYISGAVSIGDYVHIGPGCVLAASSKRISMEVLSGLSAGCKLYAGSSNYVYASLDMPTIPREHAYNVLLDDVRLRSFVLLGANCVALPGCDLPQGLSVAANVVVRKKLVLRPWHLLLDNDGTMIRRRGVAELAKRVAQFCKVEICDE